MSEEAAIFNQLGYVVVRSFLSETDASVISRYMENSLKSGAYSDRRDDEKHSDEPSKYARYADPLMEVVLLDSCSAIESIVGRELFPTYSFSRVYVEGDELERHIDRPSCEYSVTINVACDGDPWPIWMQSGDMEPTKVILKPGDAVVYKGCDIHHWRNKMVHARVNAQFMLHYVDKNGPFADYQWDKRDGLGHASVWRS